MSAPDGIVHSWFLDPGVKWHPSRGRNSNATPLLVNTVGSWEQRPQARTAIPNLFLCGDYVQTDIDLATMEGANESGRAAVNALLEASGRTPSRPQMYKLYDPPEFEPLKAVDAGALRAGPAERARRRRAGSGARGGAAVDVVCRRALRGLEPPRPRSPAAGRRS